MAFEQDLNPETAEAARARRWLKSVLVLMLFGLLLGAASLAGLAKADRLPSPPLTATSCIDEKLAFIRTMQLQRVTLAAFGSSATWRNLDVRRLENALPDVKAINLAACYLHVDQIAFLSRHLLKHVPRVTDLLTVVAPRDFENCAPQDTTIVDPFLLDGYMAGRIPGWVVHLTNFRLPHVITQAFRIKEDRRGVLRNDPYGSSPLYHRVGWDPAPVFDPRCFQALAAFSSDLRKRGIRLIVATVPVKPSWRERHDRDGAIVSRWIETIRAQIGTDSLLIDGRNMPLPDERFADPVHLLWPQGAEFTDFIARAMRKPDA
jgi:hypothetical protein